MRAERQGGALSPPLVPPPLVPPLLVLPQSQFLLTPLFLLPPFSSYLPP